VQYLEHPTAGHRFLRTYNTIALATLPDRRRIKTDFSYEITGGAAPARVYWLRARWGTEKGTIQGSWTSTPSGHHVSIQVPSGTKDLRIFPPSDLPKAPVEVTINGQKTGVHTPTLSVGSALRSWEDYGDPRLVRSWSIKIGEIAIPVS